MWEPLGVSEDSSIRTSRLTLDVILELDDSVLLFGHRGQLAAELGVLILGIPQMTLDLPQTVLGIFQFTLKGSLLFLQLLSAPVPSLELLYFFLQLLNVLLRSPPYSALGISVVDSLLETLRWSEIFTLPIAFIND